MIALIALVGAGCTHTYVFGGDRPPRIVGGQLEVANDPGEEPDRYKVLRVGVLHREGERRFVAASSDEIAAFRDGHALPGVDVISIDVSTEASFWDDYAIPGAAIGAVAVSLLFVAIAHDQLADPNLSPLRAAVVLGGAIDGMLIGMLIGGFSSGGTTDMRYVR